MTTLNQKLTGKKGRAFFVFIEDPRISYSVGYFWAKSASHAKAKAFDIILENGFDCDYMDLRARRSPLADDLLYQRQCKLIFLGDATDILYAKTYLPSLYILYDNQQLFFSTEKALKKGINYRKCYESTDIKF